LTIGANVDPFIRYPISFTLPTIVFLVLHSFIEFKEPNGFTFVLADITDEIINSMNLVNHLPHLPYVRPLLTHTPAAKFLLDPVTTTLASIVPGTTTNPALLFYQRPVVHIILKLCIINPVGVTNYFVEASGFHFERF
jgi:hypothetical protein